MFIFQTEHKLCVLSCLSKFDVCFFLVCESGTIICPAVYMSCLLYDACRGLAGGRQLTCDILLQ